MASSIATSGSLVERMSRRREKSGGCRNAKAFADCLIGDCSHDPGVPSESLEQSQSDWHNRVIVSPAVSNLRRDLVRRLDVRLCETEMFGTILEHISSSLAELNRGSKRASIADLC